MLSSHRAASFSENVTRFFSRNRAFFRLRREEMVCYNYAVEYRVAVNKFNVAYSADVFYRRIYEHYGYTVYRTVFQRVVYRCRVFNKPYGRFSLTLIYGHFVERHRKLADYTFVFIRSKPSMARYLPCCRRNESDGRFDFTVALEFDYVKLVSRKKHKVRFMVPEMRNDKSR